MLSVDFAADSVIDVFLCIAIGNIRSKYRRNDVRLENLQPTYNSAQIFPPPFHALRVLTHFHIYSVIGNYNHLAEYSEKV